jgi:hypothetical protein
MMGHACRHAPARPVCGGVLAPVLLIIPAVVVLSAVLRVSVS